MRHRRYDEDLPRLLRRSGMKGRYVILADTDHIEVQADLRAQMLHGPWWNRATKHWEWTIYLNSVFETRLEAETYILTTLVGVDPSCIGYVHVRKLGSLPTRKEP